jgi:hypothetical protein
MNSLLETNADRLKAMMRNVDTIRETRMDNKSHDELS